MSDRTPVVLVVGDEPGIADLYAAWLGEHYATCTAYGGREALEAIDERVDAVLLDRRMPGLSGDDVLTAIDDRGIDCRVAMVSAVEPDFEVLEMSFDEYLTKPVSQDELLAVVGTLVDRRRYGPATVELFSLLSKRATLRAEKSEAELAGSDAYRDLLERIHEVATAVGGVGEGPDAPGAGGRARRATDDGVATDD
jgi:DNA-binding response OmpR family regulator